MDPVLTPALALAAYKAFQKAHPVIAKGVNQALTTAAPTVIGAVVKWLDRR
jgi:hypothetical protein